MNRILNVITYVLAAIYFLVDAGLRGRGQADLKLDRQSFGAAEIAGLDQVAAALSLTRIVFGARDHPRTVKAVRHLLDLEQHCDVDYRRASQAGAGGAPFQFSLTRDKLMKIPAFAWGYEKIDRSTKR